MPNAGEVASLLDLEAHHLAVEGTRVEVAADDAGAEPVIVPAGSPRSEHAICLHCMGTAGTAEWALADVFDIGERRRRRSGRDRLA